MFWTGAAPTVPGISARFSSPGRPCSSVQATKSCQFSPAPASTIHASARSSTTRRPFTSTFSTRDSTSRVNTTLLPPPRTNFGARPSSGWSSTRRTAASLSMRTSVCAVAGKPNALNVRMFTLRSMRSSAGEVCMREFSPIRTALPTISMPSFDAVLEPNLVEVRNAVEQSNKEIGTRFDFKGSDARVELSDKGKDKELTLYADSDFQLGQVKDVLLAKLTKRGVDVRFLDDSAKIEKIGGDKVKQLVKLKVGIDSET